MIPWLRGACLVAGALLLLCRCAPPPPPAEPARVVWLVDVRGAAPEEKLALCTLQGIANRGGPRVFLRFGTDNRWSRWDFDSGRTNGVGALWDESVAAGFRSRYGSTEDAWIEILTGQGWTFEPVSREDLLRRLAGEWKGWVLYRELKHDVGPAVTWAGVLDAVPVTAALKEKWEKAGITAPVTGDYAAVRAGFETGADPRLRGHQWMLDNIASRCARDGAVSRDRTYNLDEHDTLVDADQAAQHRWMMYDLSHDAITNRQEHVTADPPDKPLLDRLVSGLETFSFVYGWGRRSESAFIRGLNRNGALGMVSGVPNNSFFAKLPVEPRPFRQKRPAPRPEDITVEDRIYIAFLVNEGDTLKTANTFLGFGSWLQPERGRIPINWGMMPNLIRTHPWLMRYYYDTMTTNDAFFAAPSGWGYAHPGYLPPSLLMPYAARVREGMELADLRYLNIWWTGELKQRGQWHAFLKATGARGHVNWGDRQQVEYPPDGITDITSNHFYTYNVPADEFARRLQEDMKDVKGPWFVVIYGAYDHGTPFRFYDLARRLPSDRFKVVLLDEFFLAAEQARPRMEGRVWRPGPNAPKGVAP